VMIVEDVVVVEHVDVVVGSYLNTYMRTYPGHYFTGDGANRDQVTLVLFDNRK
jgi:acyl-coenzyme A synthetase/AMP-(fatty) acid ligase